MTTTSGRLVVRLIRLTNIGGVEGTLEVPLADITYLEGTNGVGKSSVVDGLAALCGGPVADLLNQHADEGEVYLELTDGTWFRRRITRAGGNILTAGHPEQGAIGKAAAWLKATLSAASLSPADFLDADDARAAEYVLRTAPLTVTDEEILSALGEEVSLAVDTRGHALTVLDRAIKALYDERTGENRAAKDARTTAEQLLRSIPEDAQDPATIAAGIGDLRRALAGIMLEREAAEKGAAQGAREANMAELAGIDSELEGRSAEVARLDAALKAERAELERVKVRRGQLMDRMDEAVARAKHEAGARFAERQAAASEALRQAGHAHEAALKAEAAIQNTRQMIAQQTDTAQAAERRSKELTQAMARLDALKAAKAAELPIEGVSVRDGRLYIGDVPAHRANTAERVRVALDASTAQKARVPFVFADRLEALATKTRREVEKACRKRGIQILAARVTDDEALTVREAEEACVS
jgi:hypothetical protein